MQQLVLALAPPPEPTLDNFFAGANAAALTLLHALARPDAADPVVYLWGTAGAGCSHLVGATLRAAGANARLFGDEDAPPAALLAADDVDTLAAADQVRLFDAFNRQRAAGGRFLAAGHVPPAALPLRDDLRTRLASGVTLEIRPLSDEERLGALHAHALARGMRVPDDVFDYITRRVRRDMGTQMAVLDALDRHSLELKRPLTLPLAREVLREFA